MMKRTICGALTMGAVVAMLVVTGCGGDDETQAPTSSSSGGGGASSSSGEGGAYGAGGEGGASSSSSGEGGAGASSATGVGGAGGAGGGVVAADCLDAAAHDDYFTVEDASLCVVAAYTADVQLGYDAVDGYSRMPTWGRHHGPLTLSPNGAKVTLERWKVPATATGALTKQTSTAAANIPAGTFLGAQAIDLPFFGWTAVSYAGAYPATQGELVLLREGAVDARYAVNGLFGAAAIVATGGGRVLHSGLSALADATNSTNGLYAAAPCGDGSSAAERRLLPEGSAACASPALIAAWGESSGPVAVDSKGNAFAAMANFSSGDQETRGFSAATIGSDGAASGGDVLLDLEGFGMSLAAIAPTSTTSGLLAFQASDGATYEALDVVAQRYTVADGEVVPASPVDAPKTLLKITHADTAVRMFTDDQDRLWAGVDRSGGGTIFFVIAPKP